CLLLIAGIVLAFSPALAGTISPSRTANDLDNPHKGFMLWGTDYPAGAPINHYGSTVFHVYVPWREIETADNVFDWDGFDTRHLQPILDDHTNATFVLRPVADYPDGENSGITLFYAGVDLPRDFPAFLTNAPLNIAAWEYSSCEGNGPGITPDWNDSAMIAQMQEFILSMAAYFDGDPRVTAIQVGLLGLWGEWHQSGCESHEPASAAKIAVRDTYAGAFSSTPIQTRAPRDPDAVGVEFGFHEDFFPSFTAPCIYGFDGCDDTGDWNMYYCFQNVTPDSTNNWLSNPISGESPMTSQKLAWSNDFNDVMTVIRDYHFSFLGPAGGHQWNGNQDLLNGMKRGLGYNLHIDRCDWPDAIRLGEPFDVTLVFTNSGSAPCYHDFPLELAFCSDDNTPAWTNRFVLDLRDVRPGMLHSNTQSFTVDCVPAGDWSLRVGVIDPRSGIPGVRLQSAGEDSRLRYEMGPVTVGPHAPVVCTSVSHSDTDITKLTETEINRAKEVLHIAYGHTSHGSQLTDGMSGLVDFANGGGKGLSLPTDIFEWNNGGTGGALDLHDYAMGGDVGYYPDWYDNTTGYLESAANSNVNVILWSWCGQMDDKYSAGSLSNEFLLPMSSLETSYPDVVFVYMTGHAEIGDDANNKAACRTIRDYCTANNKVLYDFNDIEHWDPDGAYYEFVHDNCDYYTAPTPGGSKLGNWATNWQDSHTEDVDWYDCNSAHSAALNANQKAYAAWALWCKLAADLDRDDIPDSWEETYGGTCCFAGEDHDRDEDGASDFEEHRADTNPTNAASVFTVTSISNSSPMTVHFHSSSSRRYSLLYRSSLVTGQWSAVNDQTNMPGADGPSSLTDTTPPAGNRSYRLSVQLP
ncbi:MAG: DUF4832 domain-containing protein, partial [Lentisphaerae bacterium]|nr:DUF4832 domain-containing protein [Lentisphaerota bacterium]